jgi:cytidylate kinase
MSFCVAIDGPAAAGKGTIARAVAEAFGLGHLDTGLLYRAVGVRVLEGEDPVAAARGLRTEDLARTDLRSGDAGQAASRVAADPDVRSALLDFQRAFATRDGGAVLDGRDIGTVICPDAAVKIFVTATDEARAHRRWLELSAKGETVTEAQVLADLVERDSRDSARTSAPLKPAEDARLLDTTSLTAEAAIAAAIDIVRAARQPG